MTEAIIVAVITGGLSFLGTLITVLFANQRTVNSMQTDMAVMAQRLDDLTHEVREHNNFARRLPVVEQQIADINRRLDDLEDDKK